MLPFTIAVADNTIINSSLVYRSLWSREPGQGSRLPVPNWGSPAYTRRMGKRIAMRYAELADAGEKHEQPDSDLQTVTGNATGTDNARRTGKYPGTARILASR